MKILTRLHHTVATPILAVAVLFTHQAQALEWHGLVDMRAVGGQPRIIQFV